MVKKKKVVLIFDAVLFVIVALLYVPASICVHPSAEM